MLKQFPRTHLVAACGFAAIAALGLALSPNSEVEAQRISVALNLESGKFETVDVGNRNETSSNDGAKSIPARSVEAPKAEPAEHEVAVTVAPDQSGSGALTSGPNPTASPNVADTSSKTKPVLDVPPELDWKNFTVESGDTLSTLFSEAGFNNQLMYEVIQDGGQALAQLFDGDELRFGIDDGQLQEIILVKSRTKKLRTQLTDEGYVTKEELREPEVELAFATGEIESSLYLAGKEAGLNPRITMELAGIFGWDIDFVYDIRKGDRFDVLYEKHHLEGEQIGDGRILAANFINRGREITAILYTDETGKTAFYTPDGKSIQKAFLRAPIDARISSSFNLQRRHPVLNVVRPHEGTDYAAATGSPIMAAGDGVVRFKGWKGGYGRTVVLQHGNGITTLYAHMSGFDRDIGEGKAVKQGQTIGFVGSSGMVTGAHLHYEFRVNGSPRNSRTVALPDAAPVPKQEMSLFKAHANKLVARLDSQLEETQLALAED